MHSLFSFGAGLEELSQTLVLYHLAICDTTHANRQWQMLNKDSWRCYFCNKREEVTSPVRLFYIHLFK